MLKLIRVDVHYGQVHALKGITLSVNLGETVVLIGANGAGKTSTLQAISGLTRPTGGEIWLDGKRIDGTVPHKLVKAGLVHVPEGRQVFSLMTVLENLDLGAYFCRDSAELTSRFDAVYALFPRLAERRRQPAGTLSGGEQQMLAIGRALMAQPRLLMLDEPSLGLAPVIVDQIFDVIEEINKNGTTILMVEQNANAALSLADRAYVLEAGHIVLQDDAETLRDRDDVRKAYLGI